MSSYKKTNLKILDVWIDDGGGESSPIVCVSAVVDDVELARKMPRQGTVLLTFPPWDFSFPFGADIREEMIKLYHSWEHVKNSGTLIPFEFPEVGGKQSIIDDGVLKNLEECKKWNQYFSEPDKFD